MHVFHIDLYVHIFLNPFFFLSLSGEHMQQDAAVIVTAPRQIKGDAAAFDEAHLKSVDIL